MRRRRNDPAQYDELAGEWWRPDGEFAALHWLAASRAEHVPPAPTPGALLVDLACGGGLMAPHVERLGVSEFLPKPASPSQLLRAVAKAAQTAQMPRLRDLGS